MTKQLFHYFTRIHPLWLITWASIFVSFAILDLIFPGSPTVTVIKVTGIFLNLAFGFIIAPKDHLLQLALLFTLLADAILVLDNTSMDGVVVFCIAQFFHITRFAGTQPKSLILYFLLIILAFFFSIINDIPPMYGLAFIYALSLGANLVFSQRLWHHEETGHAACAALGFVLFALCDLCVATSYLSLTAVLPTVLLAPANYLAWIFYYPSQVLIANSSTLPTKRLHKPAKV